MKICIFSRPFHPAVGGLEQIANTLANEFSIMGCNVEVVTDTKDVKRDGTKFPFIITRTSSFKKRYDAFKRADVVLFMNFTYAGVPLAILARRPLVLSHHGIYKSKGTLKTKIIEYSKKQLTHFFLNISVSNFVAKKIPAKSYVVPNAYDEKLFQRKCYKRINDFVFCGRLVSEKGVNILISAFEIVLEKYPNATLTIVGDGPEKNYLYEKNKDSKRNVNIVFTGTLSGQNLALKLKEHACMVIPSLCEEAFGITALEGIASCDTVISSNRGGLPEAIGECGILIDPTVQNFAKAMNSVLQSRKAGMLLPGQPTEKQRAAHLAKHLPAYVASRYLEVCREAIQR